ncbi:aminoglycoside N(3)-acetyltransferase [Halosegnis marinus]|uniref:Aminoglycoside N(3)-acetyltransferase n=1 Tax=Halosegnis marinus TaxID=3034023 RepID=A0ABD5ZN56_9EURY|nr:AAC(3) family N-acetyltransferase [Halosegnis sp. DT85]
MSDETPFDPEGGPTTPDRIAGDLRALGVAPDDLLLVHSSLSALGWVPGGAQGAVEGLRAAVPDGTLVVPTHSTGLSDPSGWENPPIPESWHDTVRAETPAYRPDATPTRGMGAIPDCLRDYDDAVRSDHPHYSFAALGPAAEAVTAGHALDFGLGEDSPLAAVYERGGRVLVLGCDRGRNTSLHLAEHRSEVALDTVESGAPVVHDGTREWVTFEALDVDDGDFADCAAAFERERPDAVSTGTVGEAEAVLYDQPVLVDFAAAWLAENR